MLDSNAVAVVRNMLANIACFTVLTPREMLVCNGVAIVNNVLANIAHFSVLTTREMLVSNAVVIVMYWPMLPTSQF